MHTNKIMKIACVGNMNNCMFPLTRYLADAGHHVTLFLLDEFEHFLPSADLFVSDDRITIISLGWHHQNFYQTSSTQIKKIFEGFDFRIGTDYAPAYLLKARMTLDIFFAAGGDIFNYPFRKMKAGKLLPAIYQIESWRCTKYQKLGLGVVGCLSMDPSPIEFEKCIKSLKMDKIKRIPALPFLYMKQYTEDYFSKSLYNNEIKEIRNSYDFLVIQHCRHSWVHGKKSLDYKGNDLLIKGFASLVKNNPQKKIILLLFEYGSDVEASKNLLNSLNLTSYVKWFPKMVRKDLLTIIKYCDVGVGELGHSWFSYGAVYEILAMKVHFLGNRSDEYYLSRFPELYTMSNAKTEEEVYKNLNSILENELHSKQKAEAGYNWFLKYAIINSINSVIEVVFDKSLGLQAKIRASIYAKMIIIDAFVLGIVLLNNLKLKTTRLLQMFRNHY